MPLTALDPKSALIAIDLQKGVAAMFSGSDGFTAVVENTNRLARAFRAQGLPVVYIVAAGRAPGRTDQPRGGPKEMSPGATDLVPELDVESTDIQLTKFTPGAFAKTALEEKLNTLGVTQVVLTGVATSGGVDATARQAYELGFNVALPSDAMRDGKPETHAATVTKVFPRIAEVCSTDDVLSFLARRG